MRVWGKLPSQETQRKGVSRAALAGATRQQLMQEALHTVLSGSLIDRAGVWMESSDPVSLEAESTADFHGLVADRHGLTIPAEWARWSREAPIFRELLKSGKTIERDVSPQDPLIVRALVEMRRALWTPIASGGRLRGIIFAATRTRQGVLPAGLAETTAAELAMAMEFGEARRISEERQQDLAHVRQLLVPASRSTKETLWKLVQSCTESQTGTGAIFSAIGYCSSVEESGTKSQNSLAAGNASSSASVEMKFAWLSGDSAWNNAMEREPIRGLWQRAIASHRIIGAEPGSAPAETKVDRLIAIPLEADGETLGVLVAGLPRRTVALASVERLELKAAIATSLLWQDRLKEKVSRITHQRDDLLRATHQAEPLDGEFTEREAQRAEVELHNVLEWLEEGVLLFDARQRLRAMNSRFVQMAGLKPQEIASLTDFETLIERLSSQAADPPGFARDWRELARAIESGRRDELELARPVPRVLERAARPVLDSRGKSLGHVEIYRDLTAQRVFQSKLLQTEKLASLGQMFTGIVHELSNPLTTILGYAQRLLLRGDSSEHAVEARQILEEADRASAILRQVLLSVRDSRPERCRVALNQVVTRAMELQRFGLTSEKVRFEFDLDPLLPFIEGDAGQLQQVLMNLISNARQALQIFGRPGNIVVRTKRVGPRGVLLEVQDNGPGIPQAILSRIFDPFFTTKPAGIGTGLGLAIVLGIVREHGGQVRVSTSPGGGATFSIELPAVAESQSTPLPERQKNNLERFPLPLTAETLDTAHAGTTLAPWAGANILVVEDEPTVAHLIADVLEDEGLHVEVLLDGHEAARRAAAEKFDLVICDMRMPGLDGQAFYERLTHDENSLSRRFLFVTGDVLAAHTRQFLERNHLPHVAKPFRVEELTEQIRQVLAETAPKRTSRVETRTRVARK
jgi:signal transduction histidine kinase/ActR/RegA family two-component response regulator